MQSQVPPHSLARSEVHHQISQSVNHIRHADLPGEEGGLQGGAGKIRTIQVHLTVEELRLVDPISSNCVFGIAVCAIQLTMAEIQFIVDKLNEPPFSKDLRLVREHAVLWFVSRCALPFRARFCPRVEIRATSSRSAMLPLEPLASLV